MLHTVANRASECVRVARTDVDWEVGLKLAVFATSRGVCDRWCRSSWRCLTGVAVLVLAPWGFDKSF